MRNLTPQPGRIHFLDNMRMFAVVSVVALHAAIVYAPVVPWWYVLDGSKNAVFDIVLVATDGYVMPTLFFIAGYFALASLRRQGAGAFLAAKLKRLGLPLVVLTLFTCPIISYVIYRGQGGSESYLRYWLGLLPTAVDWQYIRLVPEAMTRAMLPFHLWFLSLLLLFCGLLAVSRVFVPGRGQGRRDAASGSGLGLFAWLVLAVGVAEAVAQVLVPDIAWFAFGPFLLWQPARLPLYLGMFLLGAYAWDRGWFTVHRVCGKTWLWGVAALLAFLVMAGIGGSLATRHSVLILAGYGLARTFFAVSVLFFLAGFGLRRWNRPGGVSGSLSVASYDIYLAHFPLVIVLEYLLAGSDRAALLKFAIVFFGGLCVCWGASRIVRPLRLTWAAALIVGGVALCLMPWR
ncbi:conserved hypothetical protein [Solidesulfovibrio fructosivorans JJ]]|uniref:Acyltransferase 3 domain-containing protein n=1 Tax=Solidesulfovibrio fructosivorans JJ] TaxID=596151 RepID=E1JW42_SOLFR|nr:acyltransferase family protein [Solidesulfovibrio fructosivorans]EFL51402.1 conserved hypothetical protein [Solidesulfovibrio fructosivorans JJ]]